MTKDIEDLKRDSVRLTWPIEEALAGRQHLDATIKREYARQYIDLKIATAKIQADVERARWCEKTKASVEWCAPMDMWLVIWGEGNDYQLVSDHDRNTAIDKARGVK